MNEKKSWIKLLIYIFVITLGGSIYLYYVWNSNAHKTEQQAIDLARTIEAAFHSDEFKSLELSEADVSKSIYQQIKNSLQNLVQLNKEVRFAYIYTERDGKIIFMVDSEPVDSEDYSPPGQVYDEADELTYQAMTADKPIVTPATKDRWGTWVSVLVPIKDMNSNKTIAVFGTDYPANQWKVNTFQKTSLSAFNMLFLIILFITLYIITLKNKALRDDRANLKTLNEKLTNQEEFFRAIYEQSPFGITFGNLHHNIIDANSRFEEIVGLSRELLSKTDWTKITHPEDLQKDMELFNAFSKGEIDGYSIAKRYLRPDQTSIWVNMTIARIFVHNDRNISHVCIIEDISERMKAEQDLRESERSKSVLLSNLPGMAYRSGYDRDWTMYFISEGCYELTGYRPESFIMNKELSYNDIVHINYREQLWENWTQSIKDRTIFNGEYPITTASGDTKWVYEKGQGVYKENGEIEAIEGIIIDISERKKKEDEINYLNSRDTLTGLYNRRYYDTMKAEMDHKEYYPLTVVVGDINGLKLVNDSFGHAEGDKIIKTVAQILQRCCDEHVVLARIGGDEFSILMPNTSGIMAEEFIRQVFEVCEAYQKSYAEESYRTSISLGFATKTSEDEVLTNIIKDAEDSMYRYKMLQSQSLHSSIISSMKSTLFEKSQETEEHAQRLIELSHMLGRKMKLNDKQLNELELLSTLHDIGKIGISDTILNKPDKLTDEEWIIMKKHPEIGYRIAMSTSELTPIAMYILCHHERWDGTGYPQGLKEEEIPLLSRIITIADAYDAMTSDRPYRKALSKEDALEEVKVNSGSQFDPRIAELFINELMEQ